MLDAKKVKLGMAPIGWTNDDMPDLGAENSFCQCVSEMALAGFAGTEVGGKYPTDPVVLKKALDLRGLKVCNQWFSSFLISKDFEETAAAFEKATDFLQAMGAHVIGVSEQSWSLQGQIDHPILEGKYVMNDEEWDLLTDGLNRLGQIARAKDIQLTYHHHMGTVVQTEEEIDRFMDSVDPQLVKLLFDSGHLSFCGVDPVRKKAVEGNWSFLKSVREGVFTVPGDGDVDFTSIFDILEESGYEGWVVVEAEQDPAKADPLEYAMKARKYIAEKTGL